MVEVPPELNRLDCLSKQFIQLAKAYQTVVQLGTCTSKVPTYNSLKECTVHYHQLRNNMFELADRLVGIYKTHNATKSITIDPYKLIV